MFKLSLLALSLTVLVFLAEPARARQYKLGEHIFLTIPQNPFPV